MQVRSTQSLSRVSSRVHQVAQVAEPSQVPVPVSVLGSSALTSLWSVSSAVFRVRLSWPPHRLMQ